MASDRDRQRLLVKIARLYYEDGLTQEQIGRRFGLSRIKISRLLRRAREEGIVRIAVLPPDGSNADLERELEAAYGLDEAVVVSSSAGDPTTIARGLGPAAAACLSRSVLGREVLTLSWGTTLLSVVDALSPLRCSGLKVVQMLGGLGQPEADVYGADLVLRVAQALDARPRLVPAPGIVSSAMVRDALLADPQISDALALASRADVALVGIGRPSPESVVIQSGILSQADLADLEACGAVGDIALRFYDRHGQAVSHEINDRIIGIDLDQLRRIPRVIGVAGGGSKLEVVRAALRGRLVHVLVTDERLATLLLRET